MQVVGIDLGTTNLRISTWDSDQPDRDPQPLTIGQSNSYTMPTVVAFLRQPGGEIETLVGEAADNLADGPDQVVVRNLKRYALSEDSYVKKSLELRDSGWWQQESWWWDQYSRSVIVFDQSFPVKELISLMLKEAFQRAGLSTGFEWRAGCPVHSGFTYRSELAQTITELGGSGRGDVSQVIEEPLLLLTLAHKLGKLGTGGSYLVYDLGGGSFDCALAQVDNKRMTIFGADGNPTIGGSDIDRLLKDDLGYTGNLNLLRLAKEQVSSEEAQLLPGGLTLTWEHYTAAFIKGRFIPKTFAAMRDGYMGAKCIWHRNWDDVPTEVIEEALREIENAPDEERYLKERFGWLIERHDVPTGEVVKRNYDTGEVQLVWQLNWGNIANDVDAIILCGGPTKSLPIQQSLNKHFVATEVKRTSDLIWEIPEPELTAISAGACYAYAGEHSPVYVNRLPVRITLQDLQTGDKVRYEPYEHLAPSIQEPFDGFTSPDALKEQTDDPHSDTRYELTVATPDGVLLETTNPDNVTLLRQPVGPKYSKEDENPSINTRLIGSSIHLAIDRLGRVGVEQESPMSAAKKYVVINSHSWQSDEQKNAIKRSLLLDRFHRKLEKARARGNLARNPWGWQEHPG